ncbi:hypothetical protein [Methylobacterium sp. JK268]
MTRPAADLAEGAVLLPKRASLYAVAGVLASLAGQLVWFGSYTAKIDSRFEDLAASDARILHQGDERHGAVTGRLEALERDRDRLTRLEAQMQIATDLLREIRQEMRGPPRR